MIHKIVILNPIEALISPQLARLITPCLSYKSAFYRPGIYSKTRVERDCNVLFKTKINFVFYAGLLDVVLSYCFDKKIEIEIEDRSKENYTMYEPELPGIVFREDQLLLINSWLDKPRGIIKSPTGSGKTILGLGCISSFDYNLKIIWLCHTKDLQKQAYQECLKYGFKSVGRVGDGYNEADKNITIATRQSFKRLADDYGHEYDMVVVDEVHHVSSLDNEYHYILSRLLAPMRLGLTASDLKEGLPTLAAIGLIGPIVANLTINQAIDLGILATPKMKMVKLPINYEVKKLKKYAEVYELGIVQNIELNRSIASIAKSHIDKKETVLIMVTKLVHGDNIVKIMKDAGLSVILVEGLTKTEDREKVKDALNNKGIHCVVCSTVWKEGINIPSLNAVILACGGKDPLQALGRGLRKTSEKDTLYFYDFFDPSHHYLISHFGERLVFYLDNNWL